MPKAKKQLKFWEQPLRRSKKTLEDTEKEVAAWLEKRREKSQRRSSHGKRRREFLTCMHDHRPRV